MDQDEAGLTNIGAQIEAELGKCVKAAEIDNDAGKDIQQGLRGWSKHRTWVEGVGGKL